MAPEKYSRISRQAESSAALPPVAFVDNDHVEEIRGNLFEYLIFFVRSRYGLIEAQVDFIGRINLPVFDLGHHRPEWLEIIDQGLIGQNIPVHQKQGSLDEFCLPEPPDDLKCRIGFSLCPWPSQLRCAFGHPRPLQQPD